MASAEHAHVEIAFDGGQTISLVVSGVDADALEEGLESGREEAISVEAEGGRYTVNLRRIVYLKRFERGSRVGFGNQ
jgi:hypothetical protein